MGKGFVIITSESNHDKSSFVWQTVFKLSSHCDGEGFCSDGDKLSEFEYSLLFDEFQDVNSSLSENEYPGQRGFPSM